MRSTLRTIQLGLALAVLHVALIRVSGVGAQTTSYFFLVLGPFVAAAAAAYRARLAQGEDRNSWLAIASALALWCVGSFLLARQDLFLGNQSAAPTDSTLVFILYGVPLTWLLARPGGRFGSKTASAVDAVLAASLGVLYFIHTVSVAGLAAATTPEQSARLVWLFDAENIFLFVASCLRLSAASAPNCRSGFGIVTVFTGVYMPCSVYYNHWVTLRWNLDVGTSNDLALSLPFFVFSVLALMPAGTSTTARQPSAAYVRFATAASPVLMVVALLTVSLFLIRENFIAGAAGCVIATVGFGLRSAIVQSQMNKNEEALEYDRNLLSALAWNDALTGVANRRAFDRAAADEWQRASRSGAVLSIVMIDIDHFKMINDRFGHPAGDQCLSRVARALATELKRPTDLLARYGGEEFAAVLSSTTHEGALGIAEAMRHAVELLRLENPDANRRIVTVSIGVATVAPTMRSGPADLMMAADEALYRAKQGGRNAVCGFLLPG